MLIADILLQFLIVEKRNDFFNSVFNKFQKDYIFCCFMVSSIDEVSWFLRKRKTKHRYFKKAHFVGDYWPGLDSCICGMAI